MLLLTCPACGVAAEETEFAPGGQAHIHRMGPGSGDAAFADYLFERRNPRGVHLERWRHALGCGKWFNLARDTLTLEIYGAYPARDPRPPEPVVAAIHARHPEWEFGA